MQLDFQSEGNLEGTLSMSIGLDDYSNQVGSSVKKYQKTMQIPGFRKGKAPLGLVKKQILPEIKREEVNKLLQEKVSGYIQENEGKFIFAPLMNDTDNIDWETTDNFEFSFKIALKPEISLDLQELKALDSRSLVVVDENLDAEVERLRIQHGVSTQHDTVEELDNLAVVLNIQELDEEENDLSEGYSQMVKFLLNKTPDALKKELLGKVKDESFNLKLADVLTKEEMVEHLSISEEMATDLTGLFRLNVKGCLTLEPAELNEEFYSKAFYDDSINSLEKAKERITESLNGFYEDKNSRFLQDEVKRILLDKTTVELSDGFLNEFFARNAELKDEDSYEEELGKFKEQTKWDLILDALVTSEEQSVDEKEVKEQLKMVVLQQYGQMGSQLTPELIDNMSDQYYQNENVRNQFRQNILMTKVIKSLKNKATFTQQELSREDFDSFIKENKLHVD